MALLMHNSTLAPRDQIPIREIARRLGISRNTVRRYPMWPALCRRSGNGPKSRDIDLRILETIGQTASHSIGSMLAKRSSLCTAFAIERAFCLTWVASATHSEAVVAAHARL